MPKWLHIASLVDTLQGEISPHSLGGYELVLLRQGDDVFCFLDQCTHQPLKLSEFADVRHEKILCNAHGATFDCRTGVVTCGPAQKNLRRFETKIAHGDVYVFI